MVVNTKETHNCSTTHPRPQPQTHRNTCPLVNASCASFDPTMRLHSFIGMDGSSSTVKFVMMFLPCADVLWLLCVVVSLGVLLRRARTTWSPACWWGPSSIMPLVIYSRSAHAATMRSTTMVVGWGGGGCMVCVLCVWGAWCGGG